MKAVIVLAALILAGCGIPTRVVESVEPAPDVTLEPLAADPAPPAREAPSAPSQADYERALDYFEGYCYSDCGQVAQDSWEYHLNRSDPEDLRRAVVTMSWLSYAEVDALCDVFWDESDDDVAARFDIDRDAVLAAFYYVCDT